jgi:hypothetical protein
MAMDLCKTTEEIVGYYVFYAVHAKASQPQPPSWQQPVTDGNG